MLSRTYKLFTDLRTMWSEMSGCPSLYCEYEVVIRQIRTLECLDQAQRITDPELLD